MIIVTEDRGLVPMKCSDVYDSMYEAHYHSKRQRIDSRDVFSMTFQGFNKFEFQEVFNDVDMSTRGIR